GLTDRTFKPRYGGQQTPQRYRRPGVARDGRLGCRLPGVRRLEPSGFACPLSASGSGPRHSVVSLACNRPWARRLRVLPWPHRLWFYGRGSRWYGGQKVRLLFLLPGYVPAILPASLYETGNCCTDPVG